VNDHFAVYEQREVPGFTWPLLGPGPDLPILGDQPCDRLAREHNKLAESANASAEEALAKHQAAIDAKATRDEQIAQAAVGEGNMPGKAAHPDLFQERDDLAVVANARTERCIQLRQQWLDKLSERREAIDSKIADKRERNRQGQEEALAQLRAVVDEGAKLRAHQSFIESACGITGELGRPLPPKLTEQPPVVPQDVADALAALDRAFNPHDGRQHQEWNAPTSLGGEGEHDVAVTTLEGIA
jgi:hypothetical protein